MPQILIIAEHDGKTLNLATAKCVTCARALTGCPDHHCGVRRQRRGGRRAGRPARRRSRVLRVDNPANEHAARRGARPAGRRARRPLTRQCWALDDVRQGPDGRAWRPHWMPRSSGHHGGRERDPLPPPDLRGQRHPHGRYQRCAKLVGTVRPASFEAAGARGGTCHGREGRGRRGPAHAHPLRLGLGRQERPPGPADRSPRDLRRPRAG